MARITFTADERAKAKASLGVLFAFGIDGDECPGYPDKLLKFDGMLSLQQAEELSDAVRKILKSFKSAG